MLTSVSILSLKINHFPHNLHQMLRKVLGISPVCLLVIHNVSSVMLKGPAEVFVVVTPKDGHKRHMSHSRKLPDKQTLKKHLQSEIHVGYKQFKCPFCPAAYDRSESLSKHKKQKHSGKISMLFI